MLTVLFFLGLYIFLRLKYIKAGRFIFIAFLLIEICMIITDVFLWIYAHVFYFLFFLMTFVWFIFCIKKFIKSWRRGQCATRAVNA